jgi:hypothetical protein
MAAFGVAGEVVLGFLAGGFFLALKGPGPPIPTAWEEWAGFVGSGIVGLVPGVIAVVATGADLSDPAVAGAVTGG